MRNPPEIGDIWKFVDDPLHMLIIDEEFDDDDGTIYTIRVLETGKEQFVFRKTIYEWGCVKVA